LRSLRLPLILLVVGVAAILFFVYQFIPRSTVLVPAEGGTYREGLVGSPQAINPLLCPPTSVDFDLCRLVFRGLTRLDSATGEVVPDLADVSVDNQLSYTARIRGNAAWQDGTPVSADDVVFTAGLLADPNFPGDPALRRLWQSVRVSKLDESTVRFELTQPFLRFVDYTTIGLLPKHVLSGTVAANLQAIPFNLQQPVGNGAWRVLEVKTLNGRVSSISLEPSATYSGVKPKIGRFVLQYYASTQAMLDAYRAGDLDGMANLSAADVPKVAAFENLTLYSAPQSRYVAFFINLRKDSGARVLADKAVRQALMFALDRDAIVREALRGRGTVANTPFIPNSWAFNATTRVYSRDLERARQLLLSAGYEQRTASTSAEAVWQKDGEPIGFTLTTPDSEPLQSVAQLAAQQWRELGIQVTVQPVRNIQRGQLQPHQFDVALIETLIDGDPDPYSLWHSSQADSGKNYTGWNNPQADEALASGRTAGDRVLRYGLYTQFQEIFVEELPALPLYYPTYHYAVATRVRNVQIDNIIYASDRLRTLDQWLIGTRRVLPAEATAEAQKAP
jgi:peptide/nickel transport system substrate-binding protein